MKKSPSNKIGNIQFDIFHDNSRSNVPTQVHHEKKVSQVLPQGKKDQTLSPPSGKVSFSSNKRNRK